MTTSTNDSCLHRRALLQLAGVGAAGLWVARPTWAWADESTKLEPPEGKNLVVRTEHPFNAEGRLDKLANASITPRENFYVRSNGPIPRLKAEDFKLVVEGLVHKPHSLSLGELKEKFKSRSATATLMCAGNRRREQSLIKKVGGVQWDAGAIGNAHWTGPALAEVLRAAGLKENARHVWFESLDEVVEEGKTIHFGGSIPLGKALADEDNIPGALLAHSMNDEPLPAEHGFPLRALVPGFIGARSVKWLGKLVVSDRPSDNYFLDRSYKVVQKGDAAELQETEPIYDYPLTSAICLPAEGAKLGLDRVRVAGYALAPGHANRTVAKVELSANGGKSWQTVDFTSRAMPFCWRLWRAEIALSAGGHELLVRATDSAGDMQPQRAPWNLKGYLHNAWHKVSIQVA